MAKGDFGSVLAGIGAGLRGQPTASQIRQGRLNELLLKEKLESDKEKRKREEDEFINEVNQADRLQKTEEKLAKLLSQGVETEVSPQTSQFDPGGTDIATGEFAPPSTQFDPAVMEFTPATQRQKEVAEREFASALFDAGDLTGQQLLDVYSPDPEQQQDKWVEWTDEEGNKWIVKEGVLVKFEMRKQEIELRHQLELAEQIAQGDKEIRVAIAKDKLTSRKGLKIVTADFKAYLDIHAPNIFPPEFFIDEQGRAKDFGLRDMVIVNQRRRELKLPPITQTDLVKDIRRIQNEEEPQIRWATRTVTPKVDVSFGRDIPQKTEFEIQGEDENENPSFDTIADVEAWLETQTGMTDEQKRQTLANAKTQFAKEKK